MTVKIPSELSRTTIAARLVIIPTPRWRSRPDQLPAGKEAHAALRLLDQNAQHLIENHHTRTIGWDPHRVTSREEAARQNRRRRQPSLYLPDRQETQIARLLPLGGIAAYRERMNLLVEYRLTLRRRLQELLPDHRQAALAAVSAHYILTPLEDDYDSYYGEYAGNLREYARKHAYTHRYGVPAAEYCGRPW